MAASLTRGADGGRLTEPVSILLVDDQPARLMAYRAVLAPLGEHLVEASSGTEALKLLMEQEFALVLLDVNMPGIDGFETADLIHQHPRFEKTPIIFVTAVNVTDLDRMRGYRLGAVDYVMVPIIPDILRSKVMVLCELHRKRRELQLANERLAAANEALQREKARELEVLNESLRAANAELAARNADLQAEVAERERAEARLREQDRRKDEFLATLAHELRNPLASLGNAINAFTLGKGAPDPLHATMERQLGLLVRLIDDLLDAARISRGKLTLKHGPTSLAAIIESAIETVGPMIRAGEHPLDVQPPAEDIPLYADPERLSQVFSNLLSNAAKYSDAGTPISMQVECDEETIRVAIADRGLGLSPEQKNLIFELFSQVDTSVERARGGLGIGLSLAQRIVEMHGGQVQVESEGIGQGSRFTVQLPRKPLALAPGTPLPAKPAAAPRETTPQRCRALVVDDNRDAADTLAMMLELMGHETRCIYDSHATLDTVASFAPDVVFLDIGMPGMSGYDVARTLRAAELGARPILVAVTGWGQADDRRRTAETGFDHHLVKPVDIATVQDICGSLQVPVKSPA